MSVALFTELVVPQDQFVDRHGFVIFMRKPAPVRQPQSDQAFVLGPALRRAVPSKPVPLSVEADVGKAGPSLQV